MAGKTYKCPNCGAALEFDATDGTVDCAYCLTEFTVNEVEKFNSKITEEVAEHDSAHEHGKDQETTSKDSSTSEQEATHLRSYNCDSCGAEVVCDDTTSATYCYYCHQPVVLTDRVSGKFKPDRILPFKINREGAIDKFLSWCQGKAFLPKDFASDAHLEKMTGIYLPLWLADIENNANFLGSGVNRRRLDPQRESIDTYAISRSGKLDLNNMMELAFSSSDKIPPAAFETIANYQWGELQDFSPVYLAGFFSELWSIGPEEAGAKAQEDAKLYVRAAIERDISSQYNNYQLTEAKVDAQIKEIDHVLAPAWVLTYSFEDKTYLYVMNGQSGGIYGELPLDKKRVFRTAAIISLIVFALLLLGGQFLW